MSVLAKSLKYEKYGEPAEVLQIVEDTLEQPKGNQVLVKILAASINPADIKTIQGDYAIKANFPAIGGNEFVAEVLSVGETVQNLSPGQRVVAAASGLGTWRTHAIYEAQQLMAIDNRIEIPLAATITVNPCTAYRMLKDFVQLKPNDVIIQNGANSAVGQAVHQLCKAWGIKSVGIVRDRPEIDNLKAYLKTLGATEVLTEEELRASDIFTNKLSRPRLALDCVGGKSATEIVHQLCDKGVMVTYGCMSGEPVTATTAELIYKDIAFRGFWRTRWTRENAASTERKQMFDELFQLILDGNFVAPVHELVPYTQYKQATAAALNFKGFTGKKYILNMQSDG